LINANKIKARIVELGMNQADIAEKMSMAQPTLSQKINNLRPMDLDEAEKLSKILSISESCFCDYFFA